MRTNLSKMRGKNYSYKCFKIGLNSIVRDDSIDVMDAIQLKVLEIDRIVYNTYLFIKSYFLYLHTTGLPLPVLDEKFINLCFKLFYTSKMKGTLNNDNIASMVAIKNYYTVYYDHEGEIEIPVCNHIGNFLKYEATDVITNYENLIKTSFIDKLRKYVDREFHLKEVSGNQRKILNRELEAVKKDILEDTDKSMESYGVFVQEVKDLLYGGRIPEKGSVYYDIKKNPMMYLSSGISLGLNIFPLRRSLIPSYMTLDGECLQRITGQNKTGKNKIPRENTWRDYFSIHSLTQSKKYMRAGYEFLMIKTDGKGVTVLFHKEIPKAVEKEKDSSFSSLLNPTSLVQSFSLQGISTPL